MTNIETMIKEAVSNPSSAAPETAETYEQGYVDALARIKEAMTRVPGNKVNGGGPTPPVIKMPDERLKMPYNKNDNSKSDNDSNLPNLKNEQIAIDGPKSPEKPEDIEKQIEEAVKDAQNAAAEAEKIANDVETKSGSSESSSADKNNAKQKRNAANNAQKAANKAQKAAENAKKAAEKANEAQKSGDNGAFDKALNDMKKARTEADLAAKEANQYKKEASKDYANDDISNMNANDAADFAQKCADKAKEIADEMAEQADRLKGTDEAEKAKKLAKAAEDLAKQVQKDADEAKTAANNENTLAAQNAARKAESHSNISDTIKNTPTNDDEYSKGEGGGWSSEKMSDENKEAEPDDIVGEMWDCTDYVKEITEKYSHKLTGPIGAFLRKSKDGFNDLKKEKQKRRGFKAFAKAGKKAWDIEFNTVVNTYIYNLIQEKKRETKRTYAKMNRRQGTLHVGDVIKPGKMIIKKKIDITMTFYIDKSGSMDGDPIVNACKCARKVAATVKKSNQHETIIQDFDTNFYAFDTAMHKIANNATPVANGNNITFDELLAYIQKHSLNDMINVIITDAQFEINPDQCKKVLKQLPGMFIVVINNTSNNAQFERIKKDIDLEHKFVYFNADHDFSLSD